MFNFGRYIIGLLFMLLLLGGFWVWGLFIPDVETLTDKHCYGEYSPDTVWQLLLKHVPGNGENILMTDSIPGQRVWSEVRDDGSTGRWAETAYRKNKRLSYRSEEELSIYVGMHYTMEVGGEGVCLKVMRQVHIGSAFLRAYFGLFSGERSFSDSVLLRIADELGPRD